MVGRSAAGRPRQWKRPPPTASATPVDHQLEKLLPDCDGHCRYYRFQLKLEEGSDDMDDAGRTNLRVLKLLANEMIEKRRDDLVRLAVDLTAMAGPV